MKIKVVDSEEDIWWLIGKPDVSVRKQSDAMAQARTLARAQELGIGGPGWIKVKQFDRGNDGLTIEATTHVVFDTELECFQFMRSFSGLDADKPYPLSGTVHLRIEEADGDWFENVMEGAVIAALSVDAAGAVGCRVRYRFAGGHLRDGTETGESGTYAWLYGPEGTHLEGPDDKFLAGTEHEE
jgi:hypothetical protein